MSSPAPYVLVGYPVPSSSDPNVRDTLVHLLTTLTGHDQAHVAATFMAYSSNSLVGPTTGHYFNQTIIDPNLPSRVWKAAQDYAAATMRNSEDACFYFGHDADKAVRQHMDQQILLATPLLEHTITSSSPIRDYVNMDDCDKKIDEWFYGTAPYQHDDSLSLTPSKDGSSIPASFDGESDYDQVESRVGLGLLYIRENGEWYMDNAPQEDYTCHGLNINAPFYDDKADKNCDIWSQAGSCDKNPAFPFSPHANDTTQTTILADEDFPELCKHRPIRMRSPSLPNYADVVRRSAAAVVVPRRDPPFLTTSTVDPLVSQLGRPAHIPWVETGDPLMRLYHNERKRAHELGGQMNYYFKLSQKCYHQQDWYNAREYAQEARYYQKEMKRLHTQASRRIFEQRNQHDALFIDLHGMHVDEAEESIMQWFKELENSRYRGIVYIVTGTGHHSRRGSRLRPAVASFLKSMYRCEETSVRGDNKGGVFSVYFCSHRYASAARDICIQCKFKHLPS